MTHSYLVKNFNSRIPQTQPLNGNQVKNEAGGYVYEVDHWNQLIRFCILGTEGGTYYVSENNLTKDNAKSVLRCIEEDGVRVVNTAVSLSDKAVKSDTSLFVLSLCMANGDIETRKRAYDSIEIICNTGYKLLALAGMVRELKGWSSGLKRGFNNWFLNKDIKDLSYQVAKYQSRNGWSMSDLLRLCHTVPDSVDRDAVFKWVVDGITPTVGVFDVTGNFNTIIGFEELKSLVNKENAPSPYKVIEIINKYNLPRECVPTQFLNDKEVARELMSKQPYMALLRNLGNYSRIGAIDNHNVSFIADKIINRAKGARVHPIEILTALKIYSQGNGYRSSNTWEVFSEIVDALDDAFYNSFSNVEPTNKRFLIGIDSSGSMQGTRVAGKEYLNVQEAAAAMTLATLAVAPNTTVVLYDTRVKRADITTRKRLDDIVKYVSQMGGGTDCSLPIEYALNHNIEVDCFVLFTDSVSFAGPHPEELLKEYRRKINPGVKVVNVAMAANSWTNFQKDNKVLEICGFDPSVPLVIKLFSEDLI